MEAIYYNQCIQCKVSTCQYHDQNNYCTLGKILIASENDKTKCASFKEKN